MHYVDKTRWAELKKRIISGAPSTGILYRVQIGAFASRQNAQNYLAQAKQKGFDGFIVDV